MVAGADEGLREGGADVACCADDEDVWHFGVRVEIRYKVDF